MSGIINALFGHHKDKDEKKHHEKTVETTTTTTTTAGSSSASTVSHTAVSEDIRVHSVVSSESNSHVTMQNSKKIADLMNKLGRIHSLLKRQKKNNRLISVRIKKKEQHTIKLMNIQKNEMPKSVKLLQVRLKKLFKIQQLNNNNY